MKTPKVSVCIPTYNYAKFLPEAIESVLGQTFNDFELLVIDDCSRDNTVEVVNSYVVNDSRLKFIVNSENVGMVGNWNKCLNEARGEYIKFVFADDLLTSPETLEKMVGVLDRNQTVSIVSAARKLIDSNSETIKIESRFKESSIVSGYGVINRCLREQKNLIGEPSAVMFRKRDSQRGFSLELKQIVDLEMWFHLLEKGSFAFVDEPLVAFRLHCGQQTKKNEKSISNAKENFYVYDKYISENYIRISKLQKIYIRYDNILELWKIRNGEVRKSEVLSEISKHIDLRLFFVMRIFYPFFRGFYKTKNRVMHLGEFYEN